MKLPTPLVTTWQTLRAWNRPSISRTRFSFGAHIPAWLLLLVIAFVNPRPAGAASGTWTNVISGGLWSAAANWSGGTIADASGFTANFNSIDITTDPTLVRLDSARTIGNLTFGDTTTSSTASWILDNNAVAANTLTLAGGTPTITVNALGTGASVTLGPVLAGSTRWVKAGVGSLILTNANTFTAGFNLSAGTLTATNAGALGAFGATATNTVNGTLNLNAGAVTYNGLTNAVLNGSGVINVAVGTGTSSAIMTTFTNINYAGFNGTINIGTNGLTGAVAAAGAGKLAVFSALGNATVNVLSNSALYVSGLVTNPGAITLYGGDTGESLGQLRLDIGTVWSGPVTLAGAITGTGDGNVGSQSLSGTIAGPIGEVGGPQSLVKVGASTLTLSGTNTYTGGTTNLAGTLKLGNARALGDGVNNSSAVVISGSSVFDLGGISPVTSAPLTLGSTANANNVGSLDNSGLGTVATYSGSVSLAATTLFVGGGNTAPGGGIALSGAMTGNGKNINKNGLNTFYLTNNGAVALGTLQVNRGGIQVQSGTTLNVTNINVGSGGSVGGSLTLNGGDVNAVGNSQFGTGSGTASGALVLNSGTLTVTNLAKGAVGFNISFNGGVLRASADNSAFLPSVTSAKVFTNNAIIDDGGFAIAIGAPLTPDTALGGGLIKRGAGTLTLSGTNTYTGSTVVTNGTLALSGNGSIATSANIALAPGTTLNVSGLSSTFTIAANQILSGYGSVSGNVTDVANAQISPGDNGGIGTLNFANDLTLAGGETLNFDFSNGGSNDLLTVAGTVTPNGVTTINLANWPLTNGFPVGSYVLLQATNSLAGSSNNFALSHLPGRQTISLAYDTSGSPNKLLLVVSSLPGTAANLVWQGGLGGNVWDVQTTTNWLNGVSSDIYYQSDIVLFSNVPAANASVNLSQAVSPGSLTVNSTNDYVFNSTGGFITGPIALVKNGSGSLTLAETNNYSGGTLISGGTLKLGDGTVNNGLVSGNITNNATLAVANPQDQTLPNTIAGSGQVVKTATGNLTLNGANSFTGGLNVNAGAVNVASTGALGAPAGAAATVAGGAALRFDTATAQTQPGALAGAGVVVKTNQNALTLNQPNSFSGGLTINLGAVYVGDNNALGTGSVTIDNLALGATIYSQLFLKNGVTITNPIIVVAGSSTFQGLIETDAGSYSYGSSNGSGGASDTNGATLTGPITLSPGTIQRGGLFVGPINGVNWLNINGPVTNTGGSVGVRNGRVRFAGGGDYTGLSLAQGVGSIGANNGISTNAALALGSSGASSFDLNGFSQTFAGLSAGANASFITNSSATPSTLALNLSSAATFPYLVAGKLNLVVNGTGSLNLATNNYSGNTTVNGGTLQLAQAALATNSTVTVASNAVLQLDFATTNQVGNFVTNGVAVDPGIYNSTTAAPFITGSGSLLVASTIASYPTNITASVSGSTLTLTWPGTHLGWFAQSNSVSLVQTNFWFDIPGSQSVTNLVIGINPAQPQVFYRLRKP